MDIGFGDIVTPSAQRLTYPCFIDSLPQADILAYSLESVVAEKFQAMIDLSEFNSRYKDFYDVYKILSSYAVDDVVLTEAIQATFLNRGTHYRPNHPLFTGDFARDAERNRQWKLSYYNAIIPLGNDTEVIATTLWGHIALQDAFQTEAGVSDF